MIVFIEFMRNITEIICINNSSSSRPNQFSEDSESIQLNKFIQFKMNKLIAFAIVAVIASKFVTSALAAGAICASLGIDIGSEQE